MKRSVSGVRHPGLGISVKRDRKLSLKCAPRPQINDKIDVKMVRKKITGFCQKRVQFGDFFPENFVCLPFSFSPLGPNSSEKRPIESEETGQNDKPIIEFLSLRTATQL